MHTSSSVTSLSLAMRHCSMPLCSMPLALLVLSASLCRALWASHAKGTWHAHTTPHSPRTKGARTPSLLQSGSSQHMAAWRPPSVASPGCPHTHTPVDDWRRPAAPPPCAILPNRRRRRPGPRRQGGSRGGSACAGASQDATGRPMHRPPRRWARHHPPG